MIHNIRIQRRSVNKQSPQQVLWGESIDKLSVPILDAFKRSLVKIIDKSKGKGYVRKKCTGCQVNSEIFPTHSKMQTSPKSGGKGVVRHENKKFLDIVNYSLNSVAASSSIQTSESRSSGSCSHEWTHPKSQSFTSDVLTICLFRLVDRLTEYFQFVSTSTLVITLVYLDRYLKSNTGLYFTSTK